MNQNQKPAIKVDRIFLWAILSCSVLFTIVGVFRFFHGMQALPMVTSIMDVTQFKKPDEIGAVLYRRFWIEARDHKVIVLGGTDSASQQVWKGFRDVATREFNIHFNTDTDADSTSASSHTLILVPSSHAELTAIRKQYPHAFIVFENWLPTTPAELTNANESCKTSKFACFAFAAAGYGRIGHLDKTKWTASIMQLARDKNSILVFVRPPIEKTNGSSTPSQVADATPNQFAGYWKMVTEKWTNPLTGRRSFRDVHSSADIYYNISQDGDVSVIEYGSYDPFHAQLDKNGRAVVYGVEFKFKKLDPSTISLTDYENHKARSVWKLKRVSAKEFSDEKTKYDQKFLAAMTPWYALIDKELVLEKIMTISRHGSATQIAKDIPDRTKEGVKPLAFHHVPKRLRYNGSLGKSNLIVNDSYLTQLFTIYWHKKMVYGMMLDTVAGSNPDEIITEFSKMTVDKVKNQVVLTQDEPLQKRTVQYIYRIEP